MSRALLGAVVAVLLAALAAAPALAGDGGAGLGTPAPSHPPAPRHRPTGHAHADRHGRRTPHPRRRIRARRNALHGRAMWVWEMPDSDRGDLAAIIAQAHRYRITTLIVKSSDGTEGWPQFGPRLVAALHRARLQVCAWQYVYGNYPGVEANLGARAVHDGADCLIVDAEVQYEGKYVAAQSYVHDLRKQIGARYPVALAGLPYVDYHPSFPYSVFLGPGGAQYDVPQIYWRDIGVSVDDAFAHTYAVNLPYRRAIMPLGQVYGDPPLRQVVRFRDLARAAGAGGVSWWDWQDAGAADWRALSVGLGRPAHARHATPMAAVGDGARGDLVVWLQEHLVSAGHPVQVSGIFGLRTLLAVRALQSAHRLPADGIVGPQTWAVLLRYRTLRVHWIHDGRRTVADLAEAEPGVRTRAESGGAPLSLPVPASASLPSLHEEIPVGLGAGGVSGAGTPVSR